MSERVIQRTPDIGITVQLQRPPAAQVDELKASIDGVQWMGGYIAGQESDIGSGSGAVAPYFDAFVIPSGGYDDAGRAVRAAIRFREISGTFCLIGVPVGDVVFGVKWTWEIFGTAPTHHFSVEQRGQHLYVMWDPFWLPWQPDSDFVLTATAAGPAGAEIGTLTLTKSEKLFDY